MSFNFNDFCTAGEFRSQETERAIEHKDTKVKIKDPVDASKAASRPSIPPSAGLRAGRTGGGAQREQ